MSSGPINGVTNAGGAPSIQEALLASRPAGDIVGALFINTDSGSESLYRYNGNGWVQIGGSGSGNVSGSGTVNTIPIWTGTETLGNSLITYDVPDSQFFIGGNVWVDDPYIFRARTGEFVIAEIIAGPDNHLLASIDPSFGNQSYFIVQDTSGTTYLQEAADYISGIGVGINVDYSNSVYYRVQASSIPAAALFELDATGGINLGNSVITQTMNSIGFFDVTNQNGAMRLDDTAGFFILNANAEMSLTGGGVFELIIGAGSSASNIIYASVSNITIGVAATNAIFIPIGAGNIAITGNLEMSSSYYIESLGWATTGRPVGPPISALGYNTTLGGYEYWNGSAWVAFASGIATGALDGQAANAKGISFVSNTIYMQSASSAAPGLVNTAAQTFAGVKTFSSAIVASGGVQTGSVSGAGSTNNGDIVLNSAGIAISRNIADANAVVTITQGNTSATGNILTLKSAAGTAVFQVTSSGATISGQWATTGRPSSPALGEYGYNTTTNFMEYWNGTAWTNM